MAAYMSCGLVCASRLCFFPFSTDSKTPIRELCERGKSIMKDQTQSICISDLLTWPKSADTDRPLQETRLQQQQASKHLQQATMNDNKTGQAHDHVPVATQVYAKQGSNFMHTLLLLCSCAWLLHIRALLLFPDFC